MALFPSSPVNGQTTTVNGILYTYSSAKTAWVRTSAIPIDFIASGNGTFSGNLTAAGNIAAGGLITATGNINGANLNLSANGDIIMSGTDSRLSGANLVSASYLTGTLTTAAQPNITSLGTLSVVTVTGNANIGNISVGSVIASSTLQGNVSVVGGNFTTLGTLSVTGNSNISNLSASGLITVAGNITGANLIGVFANGNSNISIPASNGNITIATAGSERARFDTSGNFLGQDNQQTRFMFKDTAYAYYDSSTTNALDYINGSNQRWAPNTGSQTLTITNWPPSGNLGELLIEGINLGASTITWPSINWINPNGTLTTSISTYLTAIGRTLQTSGTDFVLIWTRNAGTTLYGKLL